MKFFQFERAGYSWGSSFIKPLYLLFVIALAIPQFSFAGDGSDSTIIYLVRHAEKLTGTKDPGLTQYGQTRALELARVLQDEPIAAIFSSQYRRAAETAQPLAAYLSLEVRQYDAGNAESLKTKVLAEYSGQSVLIVGHSNTLDDIAAAFGVQGMRDLDESMYDRLFVVHHRADGSHIQRLRFGDRTP